MLIFLGKQLVFQRDLNKSWFSLRFDNSGDIGKNDFFELISKQRTFSRNIDIFGHIWQKTSCSKWSQKAFFCCRYFRKYGQKIYFKRDLEKTCRLVKRNLGKIRKNWSKKTLFSSKCWYFRRYWFQTNVIFLKILIFSDIFGKKRLF